MEGRLVWLLAMSIININTYKTSNGVVVDRKWKIRFQALQDE